MWKETFSYILLIF